MQSNVIPFPEKREHKMRLLKDNRKFKLVGSLASLVFSLVLVNEFLVGSLASQNPTELNPTQSGRGLASLDAAAPYYRDTQWEHQVAERLAHIAGRGLASTQNPNFDHSVDKLAFVTLSGKYSLQLNKGRVSQLSFAGVNQDEKQKIDIKALLQDHKGLWSVNFTAANLQHDGNFLLVDENNKPVGRAQVKLDPQGGLDQLVFLAE